MKKLAIDVSEVIRATEEQVPHLIELMKNVRQNPLRLTEKCEVDYTQLNYLPRVAAILADTVFGFGKVEWWNNLFTQLSQVPRWANYRIFVDEEDSLLHTLRDSYLIRQLITTVEQSGFSTDHQLLLAAFLVHDLGEIGQGDVLYKHKDSANEGLEYRHFLETISSLPEDQKYMLQRAYLLQYVLDKPAKNRERFADYPDAIKIINHHKRKQKLESYIFKAAERLGYVLYGLYGLLEKGYLPAIIQILRNQHDHLVSYIESLPYFEREFYTSQTIDWVEQLLEQFKGQFVETK